MATFRNEMISCRITLLIPLIFLTNIVMISSLSSEFVQIRGTRFSLNHSPFIFNGFNSYWMMHVASDPNERYKVSDVFREAAANNLTVCRTWAFSDGGDEALQVSPGVYNEQVFQALDFVVSEAEKYGIYVILTLTNNYKDFGGRPQYVAWAKSAGAVVDCDDDFYTNLIVKRYYKNHIHRVLFRMNTITGQAYKDDPTIMAWELINEPRCQVDNSGKTINTWVQEMAAYTKSIDTKHLLSIGMEGFYGDFIPNRKKYNPGYQVGTDFITNHLIKEIDFATIHSYPDAWLPSESDATQMKFMQHWLLSHASDSKIILKKPLVFSEFGKSINDPFYNVSARDSFMKSIYTSIYNFARNGALAGGLVWQILAEEMESYNDGYGIVLSQSPTTSCIITQQSQQMNYLQQKMKDITQEPMNSCIDII